MSGPMAPSAPRAASRAPARRTDELCQGLDRGTAELLDLATPATAGLLRWWFGREAVEARGALNFSAAQRRAILGAVVAHEILDAPPPPPGTGGPDGGALREGEAADRGAPSGYRFALASAADRRRVLQAIVVWQWANHAAARAAGRDDARFTRCFLAVAAGPGDYARLLGAFRGARAVDGWCAAVGAQVFARSGLAQDAGLLLPPPGREAMLDAMRRSVRAWGEPVDPAACGAGLIALVPGHLAGGAPDAGGLGACLAGLPGLVAFHEAPGGACSRPGGSAWEEALARAAGALGRRFVRMDLHGADGAPGGGASPEAGAACLPCIGLAGDADPPRGPDRPSADGGSDGTGAPGGARAAIPDGRRARPARAGARLALDVAALAPFAALDRAQIDALLARAGAALPEAPQDGSRDPPLDGPLADIAGYNGCLVRLAQRIADALGPAPDAPGDGSPRPPDLDELTGWLDDYVWTRLWGPGFDPLRHRDGRPEWRMLLLPPVADHIAAVFAAALRGAGPRA